MNKKLLIEKVDSKKELLKLKVDFKLAGTDEIKLVCPFHADTSPSLCLNTKKNLYECKGCDNSGTIIQLISKLKNQNANVTIAELHSIYKIYDVDSIDPSVVEKYHHVLRRPKNPKVEALRKDLHARGVTDDLIALARLGVNEENLRVTIPISDAAGNIINIRQYKPGAPGAQKFLNTGGRGINALYRPEDLNTYDTIWICGGEMKALAASKYLKRLKIGAISTCGGEGSWDNRWNSLLQGKTVYICLDIDKKGKTKAQSLGAILYKFAKEVFIVDLPLNPKVHPKGDLNDYIVNKPGINEKDFQMLMEAAKKVERKNSLRRDVEEIKPIEVALSKAINPKYVGKPLIFEGMPIARQEQPYLTPKEIKVTCDRAQKACKECPIYNMDFDASGTTPITIPKSSRATLSFAGASDISVGISIKSLLGIPRCNSYNVEMLSQYSVWDVRIQPVMDVESSSSHTVQEAFVLGNCPNLNYPHQFKGTLWSDPKTQKAVLLVNEATKIDGDLESFVLSDTDYASLKELFRPEENTVDSLNTKLKEIYDDFAVNVTGIVGRQDLHIAVDLTYFCPILFKLDEKLVGGWTNTLILGDSSQGKSEASKSIQKHYGLGEWVECKNATAPGLIGGLQQMSGTWFVTWGGIPRNDKRLMILEEAKGLPYESIKKLTELRSSGIASLDKIEQRRIMARTRLLWLSNPRGEEKMAEFPSGIEAVAPLIGAPEDIRRFDIILIVDERQISTKEIHKLLKQKIKHKFTKEVSKKLILMAWTREPSQVHLSEETENEIKEASLRLSSKYASKLPILEPGSARLKVARIACAIAARTFNYQGDTLHVESFHVKWTEEFLDRIYSDKYCGFDIYCRQLREMTEILDPAPVIAHIKGTKYALDLVQGLLFTDNIQSTNFEDWLAIQQEEAKTFISLFVRKRALLRVNSKSQRMYRKTPGFIHLLKQLEQELISREKKQKVKTLSKSELDTI